MLLCIVYYGGLGIIVMFCWAILLACMMSHDADGIKPRTYNKNIDIVI